MSFGYHDAAAALVADGRVVAAAEEERFTRCKHDPDLPANAIGWCLGRAGIARDAELSVAYYEKPLAKLERILQTHASVGPRGLRSLSAASGVWARSKLWVRYRLEELLADLGFESVRMHFCEHHLSHAASAFYPSPFGSAAVLTIDAVGEWATSSIGRGTGGHLELIEEQRFPDSLGLFYSAMTHHCGFEVNEGEYKLMGLAPYGEPVYESDLLSEVVELSPDGSVTLNQEMFDYRSGRAMTSRELARVLGGPARPPGCEITQREADIARSAQSVLESAVLSSARHAAEVSGERDLCMAGGVALNCVANRRLRNEGPFERIWVQPAAGDAGAALGAALWVSHEIHAEPREPDPEDSMNGTFLGPDYSNEEIVDWLAACGFRAKPRTELAELVGVVAGALAGGALVGWFRGRMEFGPRALGHRSILADPRPAAVSGRLNESVKHREGFRPFAPAVQIEHVADWFVDDEPSPYMLFTSEVLPSRVQSLPGPEAGPPERRLGAVRSDIAACTHVDGSARLQTVSAARDPAFHALLDAFGALTEVPVLLNTSFNVAGEPIVRTPADAVRCAAAAGLDLLVLEDVVLDDGTFTEVARRC